MSRDQGSDAYVTAPQYSTSHVSPRFMMKWPRHNHNLYLYHSLHHRDSKETDVEIEDG